MASKYHLENNSFYLQDTDIPKNKLGITDSEVLHEIEKELLEEAYQVFYDELNEHTLFNKTYFRSLHQRTYEGLYEWAGEFRSFNMSKGDSRFCQGAYIESASKKIFDELASDNYLKEYTEESPENFANKLAYYACELIALHPFFELNGRITRLFLDLIAIYNGYKPIDYSHASPDEYINASIDCVQMADCEQMEKIILQGLKKVSI